MKITDISGTITLTDGTTSDFTIGTDGEWQQWGATTERLGETVNAMETIVAALLDENILATDDDTDDDSDDE